jgi:hypothetical protein
MVKKTNQLLKKYKNADGDIKMKNLDVLHNELYLVTRQFEDNLVNSLIKRTNGARAVTRTSAIPPLLFWEDLKTKKKMNRDIKLAIPSLDFTPPTEKTCH